MQTEENQKNHKTEEIGLEIECTKMKGKKMSDKYIFVSEHIVDSFRPEFINMSNIESFVINIREKSKNDQEILKRWIKGFQGFIPGVSKRIKFISPYIITKDPETGVKTLWKENIK